LRIGTFVVVEFIYGTRRQKLRRFGEKPLEDCDVRADRFFGLRRAAWSRFVAFGLLKI
jgi:hypothetical protein